MFNLKPTDFLIILSVCLCIGNVVLFGYVVNLSDRLARIEKWKLAQHRKAKAKTPKRG